MDVLFQKWRRIRPLAYVLIFLGAGSYLFVGLVLEQGRWSIVGWAIAVVGIAIYTYDFFKYLKDDYLSGDKKTDQN